MGRLPKLATAEQRLSLHVRAEDAQLQRDLKRQKREATLHKQEYKDLKTSAERVVRRSSPTVTKSDTRVLSDPLPEPPRPPGLRLARSGCSWAGERAQALLDRVSKEF